MSGSQPTPTDALIAWPLSNFEAIVSKSGSCLSVNSVMKSCAKLRYRYWRLSPCFSLRHGKERILTCSSPSFPSITDKVSSIHSFFANMVHLHPSPANQALNGSRIRCFVRVLVGLRRQPIYCQKSATSLSVMPIQPFMPCALCAAILQECRFVIDVPSFLTHLRSSSSSPQRHLTRASGS